MLCTLSIYTQCTYLNWRMFSYPESVITVLLIQCHPNSCIYIALLVIPGLNMAFVLFITQYGSTVYIGIAMVYPH